jgi:hypothetical protein
MKVLPFEQSSRPAVSAASAPSKTSDQPDADPARKHVAPDDGNSGHGHDEPGYGHGV